jgi:hypothetical protein
MGRDVEVGLLCFSNPFQIAVTLREEGCVLFVLGSPPHVLFVLGSSYLLDALVLVPLLSFSFSLTSSLYGGLSTPRI